METETPSENKESKIQPGSLNVLCAICSEFYKNTDYICSISKCGHVFHRQCLQRWMSCANTCPQCRTRIFAQNVHRVYLNFTEPSDIDIEPIKSFDWTYLDDTVTEKEVADIGFVMGIDEDDKGPVYAARAPFGNDILPGGYVPKTKGVLVSWNCKGHLVTDNIEILDVSNDHAYKYTWVAAANGEVPKNALKVGHCENGETLYLAQTIYNNKTQFGKLHPSHGCAYFAYQGKEMNSPNYKVLTRIPKKTLDD